MSLAKGAPDPGPSDVPDRQTQATDNTQREKLEQNPSNEPPDGGYGWIVVLCVALINAHSWGINSSYGVFLAYYLSATVFPGASRLDFALVGGLSIGCALFIAPVSTNCVRFFGTRVTVLIGAAFEAIAFIGASFATKTWQLFLSQGACFGIGMSFLFVGSVALPPQWFLRRRSLANACGACGSGVGAVIYSLATDAMIKNIGLAWAFRVLGIISFTVNAICALIIKDRNKAVGSIVRAFDRALIGNVEYLGFLMFGFFSMLGYVVLLFSLPNFAQSVGLTPAQGASIASIFNAGQALGRPPIGLFSDSFGRLNMAITMTFLSGLFALVIWPFAKSYGVLIFYALIGGTVAGTYFATAAAVATEVMGLQRLATGLCMNWVFLALPTTFSEPIALEIISKGIGYIGAQLFAGFCYIAAALCLWFVRYRLLCYRERKAQEKDEQNSSDEAHGPLQMKSSFLRRVFAWEKV